jgi:hypothetical protein
MLLVKLGTNPPFSRAIRMHALRTSLCLPPSSLHAFTHHWQAGCGCTDAPAQEGVGAGDNLHQAGRPSQVHTQLPRVSSDHMTPPWSHAAGVPLHTQLARRAVRAAPPAWHLNHCCTHQYGVHLITMQDGLSPPNQPELSPLGLRCAQLTSHAALWPFAIRVCVSPCHSSLTASLFVLICNKPWPT